MYLQRLHLATPKYATLRLTFALTRVQREVRPLSDMISIAQLGPPGGGEGDKQRYRIQGRRSKCELVRPKHR